MDKATTPAGHVGRAAQRHSGPRPHCPRPLPTCACRGQARPTSDSGPIRGSGAPYLGLAKPLTGGDDGVPAHTVVVEALRADIRLLTTLLGQTLVRSEGQTLLIRSRWCGHDKVGSLRDVPAEVDARLRDMDLSTTIKMVRAFTSYFDLENVTEQVHSDRTVLRQREERLWQQAGRRPYQCRSPAIGRPDPLGEARSGIWYLEGLGRAALGDVLEEMRELLAGAGAALPASVRPLTFGTWHGGDRDRSPMSPHRRHSRS